MLDPSQQCRVLSAIMVLCMFTYSVILSPFVSRKDFDVMDGAEEATSSVFMLLANACLSLMVLSTKVRKSDSKVSTASIPHVVYHRMLWSKSTVPVCIHININMKWLCTLHGVSAVVGGRKR